MVKKRWREYRHMDTGGGKGTQKRKRRRLVYNTRVEIFTG